MLAIGTSKSLRIISILITILLISIPSQAKYSGGTGEPNNPYQITNANDLVELINTSTDWDRSFLMTKGIDVNNISLSPIGNYQSQVFTGTFDGNDCIIYNVDMNMPDGEYVGLFGYIGTNGQIKNLGLENVKINGLYSVGGLVGVNNGKVTQCYSTGTVMGGQYVGGLVGKNQGDVNNCHSISSVSGYYSVGGLVGHNGDTVNNSYMINCNMNNCYSTGSVRGQGSNVGGLVGINCNGTISNCYSTSSVSGYVVVGGLVGLNGQYLTKCYLNNCYSSGSVSGSWYVGGLVGNNCIGTVSNCYSKSAVSGDHDIGGLVGLNGNYFNDCYLKNCYSTGKLSGNYRVGGLVGFNDTYGRYIISSLWNIETSLTSNGIGLQIPDPNASHISGKTTAQMNTRSTFTDDWWDFIGETVNGPNDVWWILEGKDYPRLWWQLPEDDFNDCNAAPLWFPYEMAPELAHLEEVNGRLEVTTAGAMEDIDAIYAPYNWGLDANKPFAAQVDFRFSKTGIGDGRVQIGLVPSMDPMAMKWAEFEAGTFDDNPFYLFEIRDGEWVQEQTCARFPDEGTLYVSYDPNSDELYFSSTDYGKKKAMWIIPGLIRGRWQTDSIYIILSGGSEDGLALTGEDAWLDNFKVVKGAIKQ